MSLDTTNATAFAALAAGATDLQHDPLPATWTMPAELTREMCIEAYRTNASVHLHCRFCAIWFELDCHECGGTGWVEDDPTGYLDDADIHAVDREEGWA